MQTFWIDKAVCPVADKCKQPGLTFRSRSDPPTTISGSSVVQATYVTNEQILLALLKRGRLWAVMCVCLKTERLSIKICGGKLVQWEKVVTVEGGVRRKFG